MSFKKIEFFHFLFNFDSLLFTQQINGNKNLKKEKKIKKLKINYKNQTKFFLKRIRVN